MRTISFRLFRFVLVLVLWIKAVSGLFEWSATDIVCTEVRKANKTWLAVGGTNTLTHNY